MPGQGHVIVTPPPPTHWCGRSPRHWATLGCETEPEFPAFGAKIRGDNSIKTLDSPVSTRQRTRKAVARGKRSFESMMLWLWGGWSPRLAVLGHPIGLTWGCFLAPLAVASTSVATPAQPGPLLASLTSPAGLWLVLGPGSWPLIGHWPGPLSFSLLFLWSLLVLTGGRA